MTKIQAHYRLEKPLDEAMMLAIRDVQAIYGIDRVQLAPALDSLMVEYDATRHRAIDIEAVLRRKGVPVEIVAA